jgi:hypothetical protein
MLDENDHRNLGKRLDLFHLQEEAPGMVFWHPVLPPLPWTVGLSFGYAGLGLRSTSMELRSRCRRCRVSTSLGIGSSDWWSGGADEGLLPIGTLRPKRRRPAWPVRRSATM